MPALPVCAPGVGSGKTKGESRSFRLLNHEGSNADLIVHHNCLRQTIVHRATVSINQSIKKAEATKNQRENVSERPLDRLSTGRNQSRVLIYGAQRQHPHAQRATG